MKSEAPKLTEGVDYYLNEEGLLVLTEHYLLDRGFCCHNGCRHCPYGYSAFKESSPKEANPESDAAQREKWNDV